MTTTMMVMVLMLLLMLMSIYLSPSYPQSHKTWLTSEPILKVKLLASLL